MLKFYEGNHSYINKDGERYTSVTTMLHFFEPKKDWDKIASNYAKKHKKALEEVKALWKAENLKSIERGLKFHKMMEDALLLDGVVTKEDKVLNVHNSIVEDGAKHSYSLKLDEGVYPEIIIYIDSLQLAGQADYVEVHNDRINIIDYKSNKEIKFEGFKDWKGKEESLLGPLKDLGNCNYNIYCLQLNTYMYMLLKHNPKLKIGEMKLSHALFDENDEFLELKEYQVPNMQKKVKQMLEYWTKNK